MNKTIEEVENEIIQYIEEARKILPHLPKELSFAWDINQVIPGNGTGGTLLQPTLLGIGYDPDFEDKVQLSKNLRATVLHECFHAVQGWSDQNPTQAPETLLEDGVMEGVATVFERELGGTYPEWASYEEDSVMLKWLDEIKSKTLSPNSEEYNDYKFGEVNGVRWMLYKLGTWISDKALSKNPELQIADLSTKTAQEIIDLAGY